MPKAKKERLKEGDRFNPVGKYHGIYIPDPIFRCTDLSVGAKVC
jgi:hypothetical protein